MDVPLQFWLFKMKTWRPVLEEMTIQKVKNSGLFWLQP